MPIVEAEQVNRVSERILIGVAWPYANGPIHQGQMAGAYLPPDIFARYHRTAGNEVLMVSGSDTHGTPITVRAEREGRSPEEVVALTRRADVLVHPRLACRENYSVQSKIAVYLASGRPIVATDFGDYQSILGATGAGRLTAAGPGALADGIVEVLDDPAMAARLSAAAGPVARELFGMDRMARSFLWDSPTSCSRFISRIAARTRVESVRCLPLALSHPLA